MFGPLPIRILAGITFIARPIKPRIRSAEAKVGLKGVEQKHNY
jgi:hypothetical protein